MTALDWTPDGPNCRQCGRHDYLLHLHSDAIYGGSPCTQYDDCPLAKKPVGKLELWSPPLRWTTTPPTEPGWFWARRPAGDTGVVRVERDELDGALVVFSAGSECDLPTSVFVGWCGPLERPVAP